MLSRASILLVLVGLASAGCGGSDGPSSPAPPSGGSGQTITGRERVGWTQAVATESELALFQFAAYVNGSRRVLTGVDCGRGSGSVECSAPLPSLPAGNHTLEIAAFITSGDTVLESPRSAPLQLSVAGLVSSESATDVHGTLLTFEDGLTLRVDVIASTLTDPVDLAVDAGGRAFVLERAGTVRVLEQTPGGSHVEGTTALNVGRDADARPLSLTLAPDFAGTRHVYVLAASPGGSGERAVLTRYREIAGRLGEAAVLRSYETEESRLEGVLRFSPDGLLHAGIGSGRGGYVLRLQRDGRTPRDNPAASPVLASADGAPVGLAWPRGLAARWQLERQSGHDALVLVQPARQPNRVVTALPAGLRASSLALVGASGTALDGDLLIAGIDNQDLLRYPSATVPPAEQQHAPAALLEGRFGAIAAVTAASDGTIWFATGNAPVWGEGRDMLVRLVPGR